MNDDAPISFTSQVGPLAVVPAWVLHIGLTGNELAVYVAIRTFADRAGVAFPSIATLSVRAGVSRSTTCRALARFRELEIVHTQQRRRRDGSIAGLNYLLRDVPPQGVTVTWGVMSQGHGVMSPADTGVMSPADTAGTNQGTHQGTEDLLLTADAASGGRARPGSAQREFDTWYAHYPRKVGKKAAQAAYLKARKTVTAERLLEAVIAYEDDPNQPDDRSKIPHPATWLGRGGWDDEPLPPRTDKQQPSQHARNASSDADFWSAAS